MYSYGYTDFCLVKCGARLNLVINLKESAGKLLTSLSSDAAKN